MNPYHAQNTKQDNQAEYVKIFISVSSDNIRFIKYDPVKES